MFINNIDFIFVELISVCSFQIYLYKLIIVNKACFNISRSATFNKKKLITKSVKFRIHLLFHYFTQVFISKKFHELQLVALSSIALSYKVSGNGLLSKVNVNVFDFIALLCIWLAHKESTTYRIPMAFKVGTLKYFSTENWVNIIISRVLDQNKFFGVRNAHTKH